MNDITLVWLNLFRKKLRAWLMIASILSAFGIYGVLASFWQALNAGQDTTSADRLIVVNKINVTQLLPIAYVERVRQLAGVRQVTHFNWFGGYYQDPRNFLVVMAVDPASYIDLYSNDIDIPAQAQQAFKRERTGALVGEAMAKKWAWKTGDHLPIASNIFSQNSGSHIWDLDIVGTFSGKRPQIDTNFMVFRYDYFNDGLSFTKDLIGWMALRTTSPSLNDATIQAIDHMFANSSYETTTDTEKAFNAAFVAQFGNIALIIKLVVGAAFITILMIVGNTMMLNVRERTREIGVLKTIGFSGGRILRLVLAESILLALIGGLLGLGVGILFIMLVRQDLVEILPRRISPEIILTGVVLMVALGLVTGLIPALNAMRLKIAVALGRN